MKLHSLWILLAATAVFTVKTVALDLGELDACAQRITTGLSDSCAASSAGIAASLFNGLRECTILPENEQEALSLDLRVLLPDTFAPWLSPALERFSKLYGIALSITSEPLSQWLLSAGQLPQPPPLSSSPSLMTPSDQQAAQQAAASNLSAQGVDSWASDPLLLSHDVLLHPAALTFQMADAGLLADMGPLVNLVDQNLEWQGISPQLRLGLGMYDGAIVGLPLDGSALMTLYRGDVLQQLQLQLPATWTDLLSFLSDYDSERQRRRSSAADASATAAEAATADGNGGGAAESLPVSAADLDLPPYALCLPLGAGCSQLSYLQAIWSSIAQTHGSQQGVHFDPATLEPLLDTPAAAEAFRVMGALLAAAAPPEPGEECSHGSLGFARGRCALVLAGFVPQMRLFLDAATANATAATNGTTPTTKRAVVVSQAVVRAARLPGSDTVWRRQTRASGDGYGGRDAGNLTACTAELCPYAVRIGGGDGADSGGGGSGRGGLVNLAPLLLDSALVGSVSSRSDPSAQLAAYSLLAYLASPDQYELDGAATAAAGDDMPPPVLPLVSVSPVRLTLVSPSRAELWAAAGYDSGAVGGSLLVASEGLISRNAATGLRMRGACFYNDLLESLLQGVKSGTIMLNSPGTTQSQSQQQQGVQQQQQRRRRARRLRSVSTTASSAAVRRRTLNAAVAAVATAPTSGVRTLAEALAEAQAAAAAHYAPELYLARYRAALSIAPPAPPRDSAAASGGRRSGTAAVTALVVASVGAVVGCGLLVAAGAAMALRQGGFGPRWRRWRWLRRRRWRLPPRCGGGSLAALSSRTDMSVSRHPQVKAPLACSETAILVTDIESSTTLWEALPADVMSAAVHLHHACIRRLVVEHGGYESATEGDSFILAFRTVKQAIAFAMDLQAQLLVLPWPQALLTTEICAPLYTELHEGFPFTHHNQDGGGEGHGGGGSGTFSPCTGPRLGLGFGLMHLQRNGGGGSGTMSAGGSECHTGDGGLSPLARLGSDSPLTRLDTSPYSFGVSPLARLRLAAAAQGRLPQRSHSQTALQAPAAASGGGGGSDGGGARRGHLRSAVRRALRRPVCPPSPVASESEAAAAGAAAASSGGGGNGSRYRSRSQSRNGSCSGSLGMFRLSFTGLLSAAAARAAATAGSALKVKLRRQRPPAPVVPAPPVRLGRGSLPRRLPWGTTAAAAAKDGYDTAASPEGPSVRSGQMQSMSEFARSGDGVYCDRGSPGGGEDADGGGDGDGDGRTFACVHPRRLCTTLAAPTRHQSVAAGGLGDDGTSSGNGDEPGDDCRTRASLQMMADMASAEAEAEAPSALASALELRSRPFLREGGALTVSAAVTPAAAAAAQLPPSGLSRHSRTRPPLASLLDTGPSISGNHSMTAPAAEMEMETGVSESPPPVLLPAPVLREALPSGKTLGQLLSELKRPPGSQGSESGGSGRRWLMFRGLRVRVGIHTGVSSMAEMQYNSASARIVYGGPCVAACKAVADMAHGGQVFLSGAAREQLEEAVHHHNGGRPGGTLTSARSATAAAGGGGGAGGTAFIDIIAAAGTSASCYALIESGGIGGSGGGGGGFLRHSPSSAAFIARRLSMPAQLQSPAPPPSPRHPTTANTEAAAAAATPTAAAAAEKTEVFWVTSPSLTQRLAIVPPPRLPRDLVPLNDVYGAPVGRVSYVVVQAPAASTLMAWDERVAGEALRLFQDTAAAQLRLVQGGGYMSCPHPGELYAAFTTAIAAVRWAEGLRLKLLEADWPEELLSHELCEPLEVSDSSSSSSDSSDSSKSDSSAEMYGLNSAATGATDGGGGSVGGGGGGSCGGGGDSVGGGRRATSEAAHSWRSRISGALSAASSLHLHHHHSNHHQNHHFSDHNHRHHHHHHHHHQGQQGHHQHHHHHQHQHHHHHLLLFGRQSSSNRCDPATQPAAGGLAAWISNRLNQTLLSSAAAAGSGALSPSLASPLLRKQTNASPLPAAAAASPPWYAPAATAASPPAADSAGAGGGGGGGVSASGTFQHIPSRLGLMHRGRVTESPLTRRAATEGPSAYGAASTKRHQARPFASFKTVDTNAIGDDDDGPFCCGGSGGGGSGGCDGVDARRRLASSATSTGLQQYGGSLRHTLSEANVRSGLQRPSSSSSDGSSLSVAALGSSALNIRDSAGPSCQSRLPGVAGASVAVVLYGDGSESAAAAVTPSVGAVLLTAASISTSGAVAAAAEEVSTGGQMPYCTPGVVLQYGSLTPTAAVDSGQSLVFQSMDAPLGSSLDGPGAFTTAEANDPRPTSIPPTDNDNGETGNNDLRSNRNRNRFSYPQDLQPVTPTRRVTSPHSNYFRYGLQYGSGGAAAAHHYRSSSLDEELRNGGAAAGSCRVSEMAGFPPSHHHHNHFSSHHHHLSAGGVDEMPPGPGPRSTKLDEEDLPGDVSAAATAAVAATEAEATLDEILPRRLPPRGLPCEPSDGANGAAADPGSGVGGADGAGSLSAQAATRRGKRLLLRGLRVRAGIATGTVAWHVQDHTHDVGYSGKPVRLALRLAGSMAASGEVLACEVTCGEAVAAQAAAAEAAAAAASEETEEPQQQQQQQPSTSWGCGVVVVSGGGDHAAALLHLAPPQPSPLQQQQPAAAAVAVACSSSGLGQPSSGRAFRTAAASPKTAAAASAAATAAVACQELGADGLAAAGAGAGADGLAGAAAGAGALLVAFSPLLLHRGGLLGSTGRRGKSNVFVCSLYRPQRPDANAIRRRFGALMSCPPRPPPPPSASAAITPMTEPLQCFPGGLTPRGAPTVVAPCALPYGSLQPHRRLRSPPQRLHGGGPARCGRLADSPSGTLVIPLRSSEGSCAAPAPHAASLPSPPALLLSAFGGLHARGGSGGGGGSMRVRSGLWDISPPPLAARGGARSPARLPLPKVPELSSSADLVYLDTASTVAAAAAPPPPPWLPSRDGGGSGPLISRPNLAGVGGDVGLQEPGIGHAGSFGSLLLVSSRRGSRGSSGSGDSSSVAAASAAARALVSPPRQRTCAGSIVLPAAAAAAIPPGPQAAVVAAAMEVTAAPAMEAEAARPRRWSRLFRVSRASGEAAWGRDGGVSLDSAPGGAGGGTGGGGAGAGGGTGSGGAGSGGCHLACVAAVQRQHQLQDQMLATPPPGLEHQLRQQQQPQQQECQRGAKKRRQQQQQQQQQGQQQQQHGSPAVADGRDCDCGGDGAGRSDKDDEYCRCGRIGEVSVGRDCASRSCGASDCSSGGAGGGDSGGATALPPPCPLQTSISLPAGQRDEQTGPPPAALSMLVPVLLSPLPWPQLHATRCKGVEREATTRKPPQLPRAHTVQDPGVRCDGSCGRVGPTHEGALVRYLTEPVGLRCPPSPSPPPPLRPQPPLPHRSGGMWADEEVGGEAEEAGGEADAGGPCRR